ncbi:hypothetical protein LNI90_05555 [Tenacibaculum dicentrarchi]|uniref:Uncharacterized protein n=1 Tax=Tenacibaculum dicentrarchi TaxID=669041 RepID=A0ABM9NWR5_9FLAO|nr:hypothetical protein [Tenacibaculum dicentrarchi]MCD8407730.1 hypothetical protein [Tenacibaculum dicentrarchi]MCD8414968.1 hypothetical protein [Tenacibaculum dicentrarchi]MCD8420092.1 hypothetical protein [Tenacibaculum dicentrarchi]MCD8425127.1 hypothetical protein [Tenacibaculum dicentrarchi]
MKKGLIIIFGKKDANVLSNFCLRFFLNQKIKILLINNGNHRIFFDFLNILKKTSKCDISILTLRSEKKALLAIKAGVRFLSTIKNIGLIIHTNPTDMLNGNWINKKLDLSNIELPHKKNERILLRQVYSMNEIINY